MSPPVRCVIVTAALTAALVVAGCRKSNSGSDTQAAAEAQVNLSKIGMLIEVGARRAGQFPLAPPCTGMPPTNEFSVPRDPSAVSGKAYSPSAADWTGPWREIHFATEQPIRLVYCYGGVEDGGGFTLYASGDADGDGRWSVYSRQGRTVDGSVVIGPIAEGMP